MRHVSLDSVEPGQVLAKGIYSSDGRTLLNSGVQLTVGMINKLRRIGVTMLYVQDSQFQDIKIQDVVSDETRRESLTNISHAFQCVQEGKNFDSKKISHTVGNIVDEILRNRNVLLHLSDIRTFDNQLFVHSLNVCIMSAVIGAGMGLGTNQLRDLAVGALLHDIGKAPEGIRDEETANEPTKGKKEEGGLASSTLDKEANSLNEKQEEDIASLLSKQPVHTGQEHTWKGFNLLRKRHEVSVVAAHVALQHHEHIDGSGYPRKLSGDDIHPFAKIVAVADYYDNLISPLTGEPIYRPHEACEHIMGLTNTWFDHNTVIHFLRSIAIYPTGTSVKLSTGDIGVVAQQHKGLPARPVIRVIKGGNFQSDEEGSVIDVDLAKETTVFIQDVLTD